MKKSTILLSLALVLVLSFGAAAQFKLSGQVNFDAYLRQKWNAAEEKHEGLEFWAQGRRYARLDMSASGQSGNLKLILTLGNSQAGRHQNDAAAWIPWTDDVYNPGNANVQIKLNSARIEATGALWKGGDSVTAVFGRYNVGYSPWVAHSTVRNGNDDLAGRDALRNAVEVRGLTVGPLNLKFVHGFAPADTWGQDEPTFIQADGNLGGITTKMVAVNRQVMGAGIADRPTVWDMAAELSTKPADGLDLSGTIAVDGQGQGRNGGPVDDISPKFAFKADATVTTVPNLKLTGSAWMAQNDFAPRYAQWNKDWKDYTGTQVGNHTAFQTNRQGFKVGAETTQSGVTLTGSYQATTNVDDATPEWNESVLGAGVSTTIEGFNLGADVTLTTRIDDAPKTESTKTVLKASTKLSDVDVAYTGTLETDKDMKNEVEAKVTKDLFFADGVAFNGKVILQGEDLDYGVDASWRAPNGLNFVVGYATYNKSGDLWVHQKNPDGFYIRTHAQVNF